MSKAPNLAAALADAGGSTRRRPAPVPEPQPAALPEPATIGHYRQPSRIGTRPITVHFPEEVRTQLKLIALEQKKSLHDLLAEGFNDLFAKYGKPEIAPTERRQGLGAA
jgi:hypothetical protein